MQKLSQASCEDFSAASRRLDALLREFLEAADLRSEHWQGGTEAAAFEPTRSILAKRSEAYNASGNSTKP